MPNILSHKLAVSECIDKNRFQMFNLITFRSIYLNNIFLYDISHLVVFSE